MTTSLHHNPADDTKFEAFWRALNVLLVADGEPEASYRDAHDCWVARVKMPEKAVEILRFVGRSR